MPIYAKSEALDLLKEKGYTSYRLREEKLLTPRTIQAIRNGDKISMGELEKVCDLLKCQPNKVVEWDLF